jgi:hypothetical protein
MAAMLETHLIPQWFSKFDPLPQDAAAAVLK